MSLYSPTRTYRSADGGLVTEGPGFQEYVYESPDGSTSIREKHEQNVNREEYEYEEHRRSVSPLGSRVSPRLATSSYYEAPPLPAPISTYSPSRLSGGYSPSYVPPVPARSSPSFVGRTSLGATYSPRGLSPRDEIHDHLERVRREVDQVRAEAEAEIQRVRLDAEMALSRARSRSPPPRSPGFASTIPPPHLSPSRYSPSYTHHSVSPSFGHLPPAPVYSTYQPASTTTETIEEYYSHTETVL
eukprot:TRINITY_DN6726_c0_g1_i1.p1 TRINITY_DN6726_c0_g1~~TRINITY_DN6726_c0_g1_i1.p1  ORF type:complete len:244 (-),score=29.01 TRINITY_DN6726_c0_g1_i1:193-924(-)